MTNYTTNHNNAKQYNMYSVRLRSQDWTAQHCRTPAVFDIQLCRLVSAHYGQQEICGTASCNRTPGYVTYASTACCSALTAIGSLTCTCIWLEIAQSATDTTEGGDECSHCLQAFAKWQQSSYPISTILNPSGLNRTELEFNNSLPLNARVKKTWTPYIVPCFIQGVSFIIVLSTAALSYRKPPFAGTFGDSCLAAGHG
jgi:hypothetical protein